MSRQFIAAAVQLSDSTNPVVVCEPGTIVFDLGRINRETSVNHVEYHETLDSTNKLASELLADILPLAPAIVLTANQTAGRGRGSNVWRAKTGALTFSLVLETVDLNLPPQLVPQVSLAAGMAVRDAIHRQVANHKVTVKWPNDILIDERKACGILTEQHQCGDQTALVVGIGVNANNSLAAVVDEFRVNATSIYDLAGNSTDLSELLIHILNNLDMRLVQLATRPTEFFAELNHHSVLNRRQITIVSGNEEYTGVCFGIDSDGYLQMEVHGQRKAIVAGTVASWR